MKTAWIGGGMGFIGHHLGRRLKQEGYWVRVVDINIYQYGQIDFADDIVVADLRDPSIVRSTLRHDKQEWTYHAKPFTEYKNFDEVYQLAADMGGAGFVFSGEHDADIMYNSALINLNVCNALKEQEFEGKVFYSSSACMYPQDLQHITHPGYFMGTSEDHSGLRESEAYPANPDSEYGWEKLFSERLFLAYQRNYNLNVRIARFHNIYGPEGTYKGGREKAPAAMCRKVIETNIGTYDDKNYHIGYIEVWGDGQQTRSFLYIDDCIDAVRLLMESEFKDPINIGSEEMVSINELAQMAIDISGKSITIKNIPSNALGVRGRNSDNTLIEKELNWKPKWPLRAGLEKTFDWILSQYTNGLHTK